MKEKNRITIAILAGSLRKDSLSLKMAKSIIDIVSEEHDFEIVNIALPMYNEDLEIPVAPKEWREFRNKIKQAEGILFITPEYNRSVPAVLKNAVDVGSAPDDKNVFEGKSAAIISLSPGKMGAFGANHHLRQSLVFLNMPTMQQPEAYIGNSESLFDSNNSISNESTRNYLKHFLKSFIAWVDLHAKTKTI
jgi:chromate reductase